MIPQATGITALDTIILWGGVITVLSGLGAMAWRILRGAKRLAGRVDDFIDDWSGTEGRPGVSARPGVMERLDKHEDRMARIEHELHPNSGGSLRDAIDRVETLLSTVITADDDRR